MADGDTNGEPLNVVGKPFRKVDARAKCVGQTKFADDIMLPRMLACKILRTHEPHALIKKIDTSKAFALPGVLAIITGRDLPISYGILPVSQDEHALCIDKVRFVGDPVAAVAAIDEDVAFDAMNLIEVEYEPLQTITSIEEAVMIDEPRIHEYGDGGNVHKKVSLEFGDVEEGFAEADLVREDTFFYEGNTHLPMEQHAAVAHFDSDEKLTLWSSTQTPHYVHRALAKVLGLAASHIRVIATPNGGGFGGKSDPFNHEVVVSKLAMITGRPVKCTLTREEVFYCHRGRHPVLMHVKTGVKKDGAITGMHFKTFLDGGAYVTLTPVVLSRGAIHSLGPYRCDNVRITARAVATNTPPNGAFRGFGAPQVAFASELQMEKIAAELDIDPLELRRRNILREGDTTATGQRLTWSVGSEAVLDAAIERAGYEEKKRALAAELSRSEKRRGIGISFFFHGAGFTGSGEAKMKAQAGVEVTSEGRIRVLSGSTEIGQGTQTIFCQIVSDELSVGYDEIDIIDPNTSCVPDSGPTVASRTCMVVGRVLQLASREVKEKLLDFVAERYGSSEIVLRDGWFISGEKRLVSFSEAARAYLAERGPLRVDVRYASPPGIVWDDETYSGDAYPAYSWGAEVAEVEVDLDTFETRVLRITTAQDIGRAIHPILAAGQIEGGTLQAVGYGLFEELVWERGRIVNNRLTNYIIPTSLDAPEMDTIIVEKEYPFGPFGAKGVGELPMDGAAPAIAAAIFNATGALVPEIPITPERLLVALERRANAE